MHMCYKFFYTTWVRGVACQKQRLGPKLERGWARGVSKNLGPLCISATVEASNFKFGTQLGFKTNLPKNNVLDQNWWGSWPGDHPKKIWDYIFLQLLRLTTSNLVHKLGLGLAYQKTTFWTKIGGGLAREHPKKFGTPTYFCNR